MRTSPSATRSRMGVRRSRRACSRRCCCSRFAMGFLTSGRWRPCVSICAGRSRSICRSTTLGFTPTSLVRFRARLLLHGKERLVFERTVELASELGLISGAAEQILDSTPMLGAAAVQDTAGLVRGGGAQADRRGRCGGRAGGRRASSGLRFDYSRPRVKPECDWEDRDARRALLGEVARDAERALRAVEADDKLMAVRRSSRRSGFCARSSARSSRSKTTRSRACAAAGDRARSSLRTTRDAPRPQTSSRQFTGYKLHAAVAADAPIVTAISALPATSTTATTPARSSISSPSSGAPSA